MKLYTHSSSNAAYHVRITLNYKQIPYDPEYLLLDEATGEHRNPEYLDLNPLGMVPTLIDGRRVYRQSLAILEYLEEVYPHPPILPGSSRDRERIRSLAQIIVTHTDPLTNARVNAFLRNDLGIDSKGRKKWNRTWIRKGLSALEHQIAGNPATSTYCHGDLPTLADICLVPVVACATEKGEDVERYPTITRIYQSCMMLSAFRTGMEDG